MTLTPDQQIAYIILAMLNEELHGGVPQRLCEMLYAAFEDTVKGGQVTMSSDELRQLCRTVTRDYVNLIHQMN